MRKLHILILAVLLSCPFVQAQYVPMLNENLVWQVEENAKESQSIFQPSITRTLNYFKGDSLINGLTYKKLMAKRFYYYKSDASGNVNDTSIGKEFLRALFYEDTVAQRVYLWDEENSNCNSEKSGQVLIYDFTIKVGDTLTLNYDENLPCYNHDEKIGVINKIEREIGADGINRRRFYFNHFESSQELSFMEGIGGHGLVKPFPITRPDYYFVETILCTKNGETKIFGDCAQVASISDFDLSHNSVSIYPNPSKGLVQISSVTVIKSLQVFNAFGQQVLSQNPSAKQVDLATSSYAPGIYYVSVNGAAPQKLAVLD